VIVERESLDPRFGTANFRIRGVQGVPAAASFLLAFVNTNERLRTEFYPTSDWVARKDRRLPDVYAGSRVRGQKSDLLGIEAAKQGRFPQFLIGGQKDTSLRSAFAPSQRRC
jgi:hypothetical protein